LGGAGITPAQKQFFNPPSPWYSEYAASRYPQGDLEKARGLLHAYQNDPQRSDGMAPGAPVMVEFLCLPDPSLMEVAQIYQAFWNAAGFQVRLRQVEQATQGQRATQGDYMITCWRAGSEADPYTVLSNAFGPPDQQLLNFSNFQHPEIDELLHTLREQADFDVRYAAVERFMVLLTEEMPYIWTAATPSALASSPRVRNIETWRFPDGTLGDGIPQARTLWGQVWLVPEG
jgi:peptide/nickel transport system substrate-binding protein